MFLKTRIRINARNFGLTGLLLVLVFAACGKEGGQNAFGSRNGTVSKAPGKQVQVTTLIDTVTVSANPSERIKVRQSYPRFAGGGPFWDDLNEIIETMALDEHNSFLEHSLEEYGLALKEFADQPGGLGVTFIWERIAEITAAHVSDKYASFLDADWRFTGGAHGMTAYYSLLYRREGDKAVQIEPESLFDKNSAYLDAVGRFCIEALKKKDATWAVNGEMKGLDKLPVFVLTETGLRFYFPPYVAGPYYQGTFTVDMPYNELKDYLAVPLP